MGLGISIYLRQYQQVELVSPSEDSSSNEILLSERHELGIRRYDSGFGIVAIVVETRENYAVETLYE